MCREARRDMFVGLGTEGHVCVGRHGGTCVCGEARRDMCVWGGTEGHVCVGRCMCMY